MAQAMTLEQYRKALGLTQTLFAQRVEQMTGVHTTPGLIQEAERYCKGKDDKRFPMAKPKATAICTFLPQEMSRPITISDIQGLEVC